MSTAAPQATPAPTTTGIDYIVLSRSEDATNSSHWAVLKTVKATSAEAAIRKIAEPVADHTAQYVAVPARSWKPVTVKATTKTVITLEKA